MNLPIQCSPVFPQPATAPTLKECIFSEALQQSCQCSQMAYQSSRVALITLIANVLIGLIGVCLLLIGYSYTGTITTATGATSSVSILQLYQEANEQQQEANEHLEKLIASIQKIEKESNP